MEGRGVKDERGGEGGRGETGQQEKDMKRRREAEAHSPRENQRNNT